MAKKEYNELLKKLNNLSTKELKKIVSDIISSLENCSNRKNGCESMVLEHRSINDKPDCPRCKAQAALGCIVKRGTKHGAQQYYCKSCGRHFLATTNTVFAHTHKESETWEKYIYSTIRGDSLKVCAAECNISERTAFRWRHKFLNALRVHQESSMLSGTIEMDEMLIPISYKGNHISGGFNDTRRSGRGVCNNLPRKSYKRGSDNKSASSKDKACVCCMTRNGNEGYFAVVPGVGFMRPDMLDKTVGKHIDKESSMMIVDNYKVTTNYLADHNYRYMSLLSNTSDNTRDHKPEIKDGYHLQHVNSFHYHLRKFLAKYCGVSTKYLENYVSLFVWIKNTGALKQKRQIHKLSITRASNADCYITQRELDARPAVPMCA